MELYDFQKVGRDFLAGRQRACLFDEPGLGKTPQALAAAQRLGAGTVLICCPSYAVNVWEREIETWWPDIGQSIAVIAGESKQRQRGWQALEMIVGHNIPPMIAITTYRHLAEVAAAPLAWDLIIFDEAHALTNRKTTAYKATRKLRSKALFLLTGTPTRKTPAELFAYLQLIDRKAFSSYWRWIGQHFVSFDGRYGKEIAGLVHPAAFRESLAPHVLRRKKAEVLTELPPLTRQPVLVEPDAAFRAAYQSLADDLLLELDGSVLAVPNRLALTTRLRQLCVAPELLGLPMPSPTIAAAVEVAEPILRSGGKVVIFCPYREALPYLLEPFQEWPCFQIHGEQARTLNARQLACFQEFRGPAVLFATISMAASWSANTAATCIFVGFSFSPIDHIQSEGRLHRHGQPSPVMAYYVGVKGSIDEHVIDVLSGKVAWERLALDPTRLVKPCK